MRDETSLHSGTVRLPGISPKETGRREWEEEKEDGDDAGSADKVETGDEEESEIEQVRRVLFLRPSLSCADRLPFLHSLFELVIYGSESPHRWDPSQSMLTARVFLPSLNVHDPLLRPDELGRWIRCDARLYHSSLHLSWPTSLGRSSATIDLRYATGELSISLPLDRTRADRGFSSSDRGPIDAFCEPSGC